MDGPSTGSLGGMGGNEIASAFVTVGCDLSALKAGEQEARAIADRIGQMGSTVGFGGGGVGSGGSLLGGGSTPSFGAGGGGAPPVGTNTPAFGAGGSEPRGTGSNTPAFGAGGGGGSGGYPWWMTNIQRPASLFRALGLPVAAWYGIEAYGDVMGGLAQADYINAHYDQSLLQFSATGSGLGLGSNPAIDPEARRIGVGVGRPTGCHSAVRSGGQGKRDPGLSGGGVRAEGCPPPRSEAA